MGVLLKQILFFSQNQTFVIFCAEEQRKFSHVCAPVKRHKHPGGRGLSSATGGNRVTKRRDKITRTALLLTSRLVLKLAHMKRFAGDGRGASWRSDLEAVSDSCERTDWTLKEMEREGPLLRAWVITLHTPLPPPSQTVCFFLFFYFSCRLEIHWATVPLLGRFFLFFVFGFCIKLNADLNKQIILY